MAVVISLASELLIDNIKSSAFAVVILFFIIGIGVIFDVIGIAAAAATETPFHAKAAKRVFGAKHAIYLIRNADQVSNFCNDVVGDISGILSGVIGAAIVFRFLLKQITINRAFISIIMTGIIASLTVGGKAVGKIVALRKANSIIFMTGQVLARINQLLPGTIPANHKINRKRK